MTTETSASNLKTVTQLRKELINEQKHNEVLFNCWQAEQKLCESLKKRVRSLTTENAQLRGEVEALRMEKSLLEQGFFAVEQTVRSAKASRPNIRRLHNLEDGSISPTAPKAMSELNNLTKKINEPSTTRQ